MLDTTLRAQLKAYLDRITLPVELIASLDDRPASAQMRVISFHREPPCSLSSK